jgi:hypothetical protein
MAHGYKPYMLFGFILSAKTNFYQKIDIYLLFGILLDYNKSTIEMLCLDAVVYSLTI